MSETPRPATIMPPGVVILEELAARGWTLEDLGVALLPDVLSFGHLDGRIPLGPMCVRLGAFFDTSATLWLNLSQQWERSQK